MPLIRACEVMTRLQNQLPRVFRGTRVSEHTSFTKGHLASRRGRPSLPPPELWADLFMPDGGRVCVDDFLNISEPVLLDLPVTSLSVPVLWHPAMFSFLSLFVFCCFSGTAHKNDKDQPSKINDVRYKHAIHLSNLR